MQKQIETEAARMELVSHDLVVIHLKPHVKITPARALEVKQARHLLTRGAPVAVLVVLSGKLLWESSMMGIDTLGPEKESIKALAVAVQGSFLYAVANLYLALHPGKCPVKLVNSVEAGFAWLAKQGFTRSPSEDPAVD